MRTYKGIEIENAGKSVRMAHSRFLERDEGVDCLAELLSMKKVSLAAEQFRTMSALSSVANMNYQICNGGLYQYFDNGYDQERAPVSTDDVMQLDKEAQVEMLRELLAFGKAIFPECKLENERLDRIIADFDAACYEEEEEVWYDDDDCEDGGYYEEEGGLFAPYDFDRRYYMVNGYIEALIEAYAQYLIKSFRAA